MAKVSAGLLILVRGAQSSKSYSYIPADLLWPNNDKGEWTIPKEEVVAGQRSAHNRVSRIRERNGVQLEDSFQGLSLVKQRAGKRTVL